MKLVKIKFLDHFATAGDVETVNFYLTAVGYDMGVVGKYTRLCMLLGNDGEPHAPYMSIITDDIAVREVLNGYKNKGRSSSLDEGNSPKVSRSKKAYRNNTR